MSRKWLMPFLRATVEDGAVALRAYKSTPAFVAELEPGTRSKPDAEPFRALRVYRKPEPGFAFGEDYAEYFDGLSWREAELIFEGPLPAGNKRKFTYVDRTAAVGVTYAYWLGAAEGEPIGPAPVKVRDPEVWWSHARVAAELVTLQARYPDRVRVECIGRTARGLDILALHAGAARPCLGLVGAVHPGESGAELILPAIAAILADPGDLLDRVGIAAVPVVNGDERERLACGVPWYLRTNAAGVDLNRNFPVDWDHTDLMYGLDTSDPDAITYRGPAPASEPETQALIGFLRRDPVAALFSFHNLASICGMGFLGPGCGEGDAAYVRRCRNLAERYGAAMAPDGLFTAEQACFGTTAGSLASWCYREMGIPAFDVEMSGPREPEALAQCRVDRTDRALLTEYRQRHTRGVRAALEALNER